MAKKFIDENAKKNLKIDNWWIRKKKSGWRRRYSKKQKRKDMKYEEEDWWAGKEKEKIWNSEIEWWR